MQQYQKDLQGNCSRFVTRFVICVAQNHMIVHRDRRLCNVGNTDNPYDFYVCKRGTSEAFLKESFTDPQQSVSTGINEGNNRILNENHKKGFFQKLK